MTNNIINNQIAFTINIVNRASDIILPSLIDSRYILNPSIVSDESVKAYIVTAQNKSLSQSSFRFIRNKENSYIKTLLKGEGKNNTFPTRNPYLNPEASKG